MREMATRLDRLWVLLECGSTPVTRRAAAEQIGEIQKLHPHELHNLLKKVCKYLNNKTWETRVAAAQTVEAIAKNVKKWDPPFQPKSDTTTPNDTVITSNNDITPSSTGSRPSSPAGSNSDHLTFESFDIVQVLQYGTPLLSSTGDEFSQLEDDPDYQKMSTQEKAAFHRQQLKQKLGLVAQGKVFSTGLEQLFDDEDLLLSYKKQTVPAKHLKQPVNIPELNALGGMSARERNRAKRKAKMAARKSTREKEQANESSSEPPNNKRPKTSPVVVEQTGDSEKVVIDQIADNDAIFEESDEWPFTWFCEEMFRQLFSPQWEVRHGAASALREIIKLHGDTAGISASTPQEQRSLMTQQWLSDAAIRLLCVFALDRFADFVSDQVVAPVRATCAQVLGIVCKQLEDERLRKVMDILLILVQQLLWEVRHATLMGIQHILAARMDLATSLLPLVGDSILRALQDADDDVRAVAAGALLPVADQLHTSFKEKVLPLVQILWDSLLQLDDLSASTSAVMDLLSTLLTYLPQTQSTQLASLLSDSALSNFVPRLYPFLSHTISAVRGSCLRTIKNLMMMEDVESTSHWVTGILDSLMGQIFQRLALEGDTSVLNIAFDVWERMLALCNESNLSSVLSVYLMQWLGVLVTPSSMAVEQSLLVGPLSRREGGSTREVYLGGCLGIETVTIKEQASFTARVNSIKALGLLAKKISSSFLLPLVDSLRQMVASISSTYKVLSALLVISWGSCPPDIAEKLKTILTEQCLYEEMSPFLLSLQKDCHVLITALEKKGVDASGGVNPSGYNTEFAVQLATTTYTTAMKSLVLTPEEKQDFETFHRNLLTTLGQLQEQCQTLQGRVQCCVAGSLITLSNLPVKLNPIIRPLMECLKTQTDSYLQSLSAQWLSSLLDICHDRTPCPNAKIIKNLCNYLCCDVQHTPSIQPSPVTSFSDIQLTSSRNGSPIDEEDPGKGRSNLCAWTWNDGIISLQKSNTKTKKSTRGRRGPGRPSAAMKEALAEANSAAANQQSSLDIQRQGGEVAMTSLAKHFGSYLFVKLPNLWSLIVDPLNHLPMTPTSNSLSDDLSKDAQTVVNGLQVLEVLAPATNVALKEQLLSLLASLLSCITSSFTAIRHMAARCTAALAHLDLHETMKFFMDKILPFLGDSSNNIHRQGAIEVIACLIDTIDLDLLCYVVLLVMPVLGRMSDQHRDVRLMASQCFAKLVTLMPLESGISSPSMMPASLAERRNEERKFLEQLLDSSKLDNYRVPIPIKADLRKYQQDGINWLAFLNKYKVHGILCDDMGLGKTLQSICIVAGDHYDRQQKYKVTGLVDCKPLPSIVVCPPTLTGHWFYEVKKFCSNEHLRPLQYMGPPSTRSKLQKQVTKHNLIIVSYDIVRNDIEFFKEIHWNYCILDEGHVIKNTKTKITKAVKMLNANHRLILSGTPIQNNVLELWSLFDFLMPGFLGTEQQFNERYGRPILLSRDAKSSSKEQEAGALAMEALHRQVLPFLLRRMKEDVLQDLPPKIIQDYHCDLSPLQVLLYEDFAQSRARQNVEEVISEEDNKEMVIEEKEVAVPEKKRKVDSSQTHIFQALQYLRKVCNHPVLVVSPDHPLYNNVMQSLSKENSSLHDINHSAKLLALKQLLHECGIGTNESNLEQEACLGGAVVSQHRVLLFCQYKTMLDIIEKDLLKVHMPTVTYLRLDGSVPANSRHSLVHRFNTDPSIDLLLLTTPVGGLGLNLTGADTVIFFEHDWNPMKDLQAMDRAHRIGQKRVVHVYRLITRGTLEEKIMSLQKFKLNIANTVITQENSSLLSMNTSDFLDLFQLGEEGKGTTQSDTRPRPDGTKPDTSGGLKTVLDNLPELWDESLYHNEYDLGTFMNSLQPSSND